MRTVVTTRNYYTLEELSGKARENAIDGLRWGLALDEGWDEPEIEDLKNVGALMGIEMDNVLFSAGGVQGDGACFVGRYAVDGPVSKRLKDSVPDEVPGRIAAQLDAIQKTYDYTLTASTVHNDSYVHSGSVDITVESVDGREVADDVERAVKDLLREFMDHMYSMILEQKDFVQREENILELAENNFFEFTESGQFAGRTPVVAECWGTGGSAQQEESDDES